MTHSARKFTTTLVVPTLNEIDGMRAIMPQVQADWVDQILVIDGGSVDGTAEYVILDKISEGFDMVIASRYLGDAQSDDDDFVTAFGNWFFTRTVNLLYGGRYTDVMVIYRAYWKQLIFALDLDKDESHQLPERLFATRISWEPLLSVRAVKAGLQIAEVPGPEPVRIGGGRKLRVARWGAAYYFQFLREWLFWNKSIERTWGPAIRRPEERSTQDQQRRCA